MGLNGMDIETDLMVDIAKFVFKVSEHSKTRFIRIHPIGTILEVSELRCHNCGNEFCRMRDSKRESFKEGKMNTVSLKIPI